MSMEKDIMADLYQKFNTGDIPGVLKGYHDDAVWSTPPNVPWTKGTCKGKDEIAGYFKAVAENNSSIRCIPQEYIMEGNTMIVLGYVEATAMESGINYATRFAHVATWDNQKISKFEDILDSAEVLKAFR